MFQTGANHWPMGFFHAVLSPHFTGGVAPSRHDVALAAYLEKQAAHCEAAAAEHLDLKITMRLRGLLYQAARCLAGAVWHPQLGRFKISR
jgi:hypothetical protein